MEKRTLWVMEIAVLGPLEVHDGERTLRVTGAQERTVLACLALRAGRVVSLADLVDVVWGQRPPRSAPKSLQVLVSRIRDALEPDRAAGGRGSLICTTGSGYRLDLPADAVDALRFSALARAGRRLLGQGAPALAAGRLHDALRLWRGPPLAGTSSWLADTEGRRLEEQRLDVEEHLADAELALGRHTSLVPELRQRVDEAPFRERRWAQLMLALYRAGRQAEALDVYRQARRRLVAELGVEPGDELRALQQAVLAHHPDLAWHPAAAALPSELDPPDPVFVGRDAELTRLAQLWQETLAGRGGLVLVAGRPGSGRTRMAAELARIVRADGGIVLYTSAAAVTTDPLRPLRLLREQLGLPAPDDHLGGALHQIGEGPGALVVVDDVGRDRSAVHDALAALHAELDSSRVLLLACADEPAAVPVDLAEDRVVPLGALDLAAITDIARLYVGDDAEVAGGDVAVQSAGRPGAAHTAAAAWARARTSSRIALTADTATRQRAALEAATADVADGVVDLQRLDVLRPGGRPPARPTASPYPGLRYFEVGDADHFFGRERLLAELLAEVATRSLVALVGPSGSGKSSLLRAGLLAGLTRGLLPGAEAWRQVLVRPGDHPLATLRAAWPASAAGPGVRTLLAIDQLEEVITSCTDPQERIAFLDELADLAERGDTTVVVTLRSDFYGDVAVAPAFAGLLARGAVLIGAMTADEVQRAVELPARRAGSAVEPALTAALVAECTVAPGALPLLSAALRELWEQGGDRPLSLAAHRSRGGLPGAVARLAEGAWAALDGEQQTAARRILLRLARGAGEAATGRRVAIGDLGGLEGPVDTALAVLVERRLITVDGGVAEVAHEALLRDWPRLAGWLEEDRAGRAVQARLVDDAREWEEAGRRDADLYRGDRLAAAAAWASAHPDQLTPGERDFLDASSASAERAADEARTQASRMRSANRRLRGALAGVGILLVVAVVAGALIVVQRRVAEREARAAQAAALGSAALLTDRLDHALLLAVEARHLHDSAATRDTLLATLLREPELTDLGVNDGGPGWYRPLLQPRGALLAVYPWGYPAAFLDLYDRDSLARVGRLRVPGTTAAPFIGDAVWSVDGETLAVVVLDLTAGAETSRVVWFDVASGSVSGEWRPETAMLSGLAYHPEGVLYGTTIHGELLRFGGPGSEPEVLTEPAWFLDLTVPELVVLPSLALTAQGHRAVVSWTEHETAVYDLRGGPPVRFEGGGQFVLHPDGRRMIHADPLGIRVRDLADGRELRRFAWAATESERFSSDYQSLALDADASRLAAFRRSDKTIQVWELDSGQPLAELHPVRPPGGLAFDGDRVIASDDAAIGVWDLTRASPLTTALSRGDDTHLAVTPDGRHSVSAGIEGELLVRDLIQGEQRSYPVPGGGVASLALRPDGRVAATAGVDGTVAVLDLERGALVAEPVAPHPPQELGYLSTIGTIAFTPDGRYLLTAGWDGRVAVLDTTTGRQAQDVTTDGAPAGDGPLNLVGVAPDGSMVAAFYDGGDLVMWDWPSRQERYRAPFPEAAISLAFSPDGRQLLVGDIEGRLHRIDATDGGRIGAPLPLHGGPITSVAFSSDGRTIATGSLEGTARLVDTAAFRAIGTPLQLGAGRLSVAFLPEGDRVLVGQERSTTSALLWDVDPDRWEARACELAGRDLSSDEWAALMPQRPPRPICHP